MANTMSALKNVRSSLRKRAHNLLWKKRVKDLVKTIKEVLSKKGSKSDDLVLKLQTLQKNVDKAVKEKVIHKNKANRLKSMYAQKISAFFAGKVGKTTSKPAKRAK